MMFMELLVILLLAIILVLVAAAAFLCFLYLKTRKTFNKLLENGNLKDMKDVLFSQIEKTKTLESLLNQVLQRLQSLEEISKITFQNMGVVRFNPFGEMGGNQSFTIALLDANQTGVVISSIFVKEGSRVYAKSIMQGKSDHILSDEERQAIAKALKK